MAAVRQDYLLAQIDLLRQFVARLLRSRDRAGLDEALRLALGLQEKLFPLPVPEFLQLDVDAQLSALRKGETPTHGCEKGLIYAQLLHETASLYEFRGRPDLAAGARQLALQIALLLALETSPSPSALVELIHTLRQQLETDALHPPVRELLAAWDSRSA